MRTLLPPSLVLGATTRLDSTLYMQLQVVPGNARVRTCLEHGSGSESSVSKSDASENERVISDHTMFNSFVRVIFQFLFVF